MSKRPGLTTVRLELGYAHLLQDLETEVRLGREEAGLPKSYDEWISALVRGAVKRLLQRRDFLPLIDRRYPPSISVDTGRKPLQIVLGDLTGELGEYLIRLNPDKVPPVITKSGAIAWAIWKYLYWDERTKEDILREIINQ